MRYFNLHTHKSGNDPGVVELVNQYPDEFDASVPVYSIGIHPWYINEDRLSDDLEIIEKKLAEKNCLAIGECGLDKRIETPIGLQQQVFEKQLLLAEKYRKPVVMHCVAAYAETIEIKKRLKISVPMIIHGFSKNAQTAKQLLDAGFYLSFGKHLMRNPDLEIVFQAIPNDRFFLETDMIDETIRDVYALAANYKNMKLEQLQEIVNQNFHTVFNANNLNNDTL
jgi:TatD DNase family protein